LAQSYTSITQNRSVRVLGRRSDRYGGGRDSHAPDNIYVEYPLPLLLWQTRAGFDLLGQLAQGIEQQIKLGLAVGGSYVQDYDANNLLVDYCEMVVQYDPGDGRPPQRTTVLVALGGFHRGGRRPVFFQFAANPGRCCRTLTTRCRDGGSVDGDVSRRGDPSDRPGRASSGGGAVRICALIFAIE